MHVSDAAAGLALRFQSCCDRAVSRSPTNDQEIAIRIASRHDIRNVLADGLDLCGTHANHFFVIQRLVVYVAGDVLLLESANAMFQTGRSRNGPGTRERLRVALIRQKAFWVRYEMYGELRNLADVGNAPRLRTIRQVAVREHDYRNHVLQCNAAGFDGDPETIAGGGSRENGNRSFGVSAVHGLEQIGLFGLSRKARRRATALDVADHHGKLDSNGQAHGLSLQSHSRTGSRGDSKRSGIC